jgi:hypothetical protein
MIKLLVCRWFLSHMPDHRFDRGIWSDNFPYAVSLDASKSPMTLFGDRATCFRSVERALLCALGSESQFVICGAIHLNINLGLGLSCTENSRVGIVPRRLWVRWGWDQRLIIPIAQGTYSHALSVFGRFRQLRTCISISIRKRDLLKPPLDPLS